MRTQNKMVIPSSCSNMNSVVFLYLSTLEHWFCFCGLCLFMLWLTFLVSLFLVQLPFLCSCVCFILRLLSFVLFWRPFPTQGKIVSVFKPWSKVWLRINLDPSAKKNVSGQNCNCNNRSCLEMFLLCIILMWHMWDTDVFFFTWNYSST